MIQIIDNFAATYSLLIIGLFECVVLSWVYGIDNFFKDIEMMIGRKPTVWWKIMWAYVTPALLFVSFHLKQECIPVGCVPSAAGAVSGAGRDMPWGVCLPRGEGVVSARGGGCLGDVVSVRGGSAQGVFLPRQISPPGQNS